MQGSGCTVTFTGPGTRSRPPQPRNIICLEDWSPPPLLCLSAPAPLLLVLPCLPLPSHSLLAFPSAALPAIRPSVLCNRKRRISANSPTSAQAFIQSRSDDLDVRCLWATLFRQLEAVCHRGHLHINRSQCGHYCSFNLLFLSPD